MAILKDMPTGIRSNIWMFTIYMEFAPSFAEHCAGRVSAVHGIFLSSWEQQMTVMKWKGVDKLTHRQFINFFLSYDPRNSIELKLAHYLKLELDGKEMFMLKWLGMFDDELVGLDNRNACTDS